MTRLCSSIFLLLAIVIAASFNATASPPSALTTSDTNNTAAIDASRAKITVRHAPRAAIHSSVPGVAIAYGNGAQTQVLSELYEGWVSSQHYLNPGDVVYDGAIMNNGTEIITLGVIGAPGQTIDLLPGQNIILGLLAMAGGSGCVCQCDEGWVYRTHAQCGGSNCSGCNGGLPCIDPTDHELHQPGYANCQPGNGYTDDMIHSQLDDGTIMINIQYH